MTKIGYCETCRETFHNPPKLAQLVSVHDPAICAPVIWLVPERPRARWERWSINSKWPRGTISWAKSAIHDSRWVPIQSTRFSFVVDTFQVKLPWEDGTVIVRRLDMDDDGTPPNLEHDEIVERKG
jgi:hypothetical protein